MIQTIPLRKPQQSEPNPISHFHEQSPSPLVVKTTKLSTQLEHIGVRKIDLTHALQSLYGSVKAKDRSMYGISLYQTAKSNEQNGDGDGENVELVKRQLGYVTKMYICSCQFLRYQHTISPSLLTTHLSCLPTSENQLDEIRLQPPNLVLQKHTRMICLNLQQLTPTPRLLPNKYLLDIYDPEANNQLAKLEYQVGLGWVQIQDRRYSVPGLVRIVLGIQGMVAIVTDRVVEIVVLGKETGIRVEVEDCVDAKWGKLGLYYLDSSNKVRLLSRSLHCSSPKFQQTNLHLPVAPSVSPQRLIPTPNSIYLLSMCMENSKKFILQEIYSSTHGLREDIKIGIDMGDIDGEILWKDGYSVGGGTELKVGVVWQPKQLNGLEGDLQFWEFRISTF